MGIIPHIAKLLKKKSRGETLDKFDKWMGILAIVLVILIIPCYIAGTRVTPSSLPIGFESSEILYNKSINNNIGYNHYREGNYKEANNFFDLALKEDPGYILALSNKGKALEKLGREEEADANFAKARSLRLSLCPSCP